MKNEKLEIIESNEFQNLFDKSKKLIDSARSNMGQMANAITVLTSFLLGRYIIEQEQQGSERAKYGAKVLDSLSSYLTEEYGRGFSRSNVAGMRQFYMAYKDREEEIIQSGIGQFEQAFGIVQSGIGQLETAYKKIQMCIRDSLEGYITCQQTNKAFENAGSSWYFRRNSPQNEVKTQECDRRSLDWCKRTSERKSHSRYDYRL